MKTSLTLLMNIINCSNRLFGVEKAPLLISSATAIYLGIPVLHEVFKIFRAEILFQKQVRITFDVKSQINWQFYVLFFSGMQGSFSNNERHGNDNCKN